MPLRIEPGSRSEFFTVRFVTACGIAAGAKTNEAKHRDHYKSKNFFHCLSFLSDMG